MTIARRLKQMAGDKVFGSKPPASLVADTLNTGAVRRQRRKVTTEDFRIHVSDLMKMDPAWKFCPREFALHWLTRKEYGGSSLSPGFELLFQVGHAIHDHSRNAFIERSPYGRTAFGKWLCACRKTVHLGTFKPANVCKHCGTETKHYDEWDLYSPKYKLIGHPDFLIQWGKWIIIYEIKTIERADIDFDSMISPLGDHTLQATFYYWMLKQDPTIKKMGLKVHPDIRYLYVDRSTRKLFGGIVYKEFQARVSPKERLRPFLNKAETLIASINDNRLPADKVCRSVSCTRAKSCKVAIECFSRKTNKVDPAFRNQT